MREDMPGGAAEDHLPQAALRVGALDDEVAAELGGFAQDRLAGISLAAGQRDRGRGDAVSGQRMRKLFAARPGDGGAFDGQDRYTFRALEQRHGERGGARLLGRAVPGDQDVGGERRRRSRRCDQDRASAFEQSRLERHHRGALPFLPRSPQHDEVEHPPVAADEVVAARGVGMPTPGHGGGGRRSRGRGDDRTLGRSVARLLRNAAPLHEGAEQLLGLPHHVGVVLLHRHHGHAGVRIHGHHLGDRRPQRKALDAAGEFLRQQQRALQRLFHRTCLLGGNENRFHRSAPHDLPSFSGSCADHIARPLRPIEQVGYRPASSQRLARHLDGATCAG